MIRRDGALSEMTGGSCSNMWLVMVANTLRTEHLLVQLVHCIVDLLVGGLVKRVSTAVHQ
jgi:hypothetical protein